MFKKILTISILFVAFTVITLLFSGFKEKEDMEAFYECAAYKRVDTESIETFIRDSNLETLSDERKITLAALWSEHKKPDKECEDVFNGMGTMTFYLLMERLGIESHIMCIWQVADNDEEEKELDPYIKTFDRGINIVKLNGEYTIVDCDGVFCQTMSPDEFFEFFLHSYKMLSVEEKDYITHFELSEYWMKELGFGDIPEYTPEDRIDLGLSLF